MESEHSVVLGRPLTEPAAFAFFENLCTSTGVNCGVTKRANGRISQLTIFRSQPTDTPVFTRSALILQLLLAKTP